MARQYRESFDVYGTKKSFEWTLDRGRASRDPYGEEAGTRDSGERSRCLTLRTCSRPEIQKFTLPQEIHDAEHLSFLQGGGHGGSHPHLVNEFASALLENRDPWPNAVTSANWTCVGICAHESALKGGDKVVLPGFTQA